MDSKSPEELRGSELDRQSLYFDFSLPPLYRLEDIFRDITERALSIGPDFEFVLRFSLNRPFRVATMCSGTESPLFALNMVKKALENIRSGLVLNFQHVFSCEIVPYKQAYIERNCRPPMLFRDITEMGNDQARTAYGVLTDVPGDIDLLIVGTSCVDFSLLNNKKKGLDDDGQSAKTFAGLCAYVKSHGPSILVFENVQSGDWDGIQSRFNALGYTTEVIGVDSKNFYLPQTRRRKYMICFKKQMDPCMEANLKSNSVESLVGKFQRRASCPGGFFLIEENTKRMDQIVNDREVYLNKDRYRRNQEPWVQGIAKHKKEREQGKLGFKRPVSQSIPGDTICKAPDFYQHCWFERRAEREWELIDIIFLQHLVFHGFDMNFKERWIDTSQAVDRGKFSIAKFGNLGCITPKGNHFCSTRGGEITGEEALALQGLPISQMIFTRESQAQLQDLAGNAMTSTVVCAVMLSALVRGCPYLNPNPSPSDRDRIFTVPDVEREMLAKMKFAEDGERSDDAIPASTEDVAESTERPNLCADIPKLQDMAMHSSQYCYCEKQTETRANILKCSSCKFTACESCSGNPMHDQMIPFSTQRLEPLEMIKDLRMDLPARLCLSGLDRSMFDEFLESIPGVEIKSTGGGRGKKKNQGQRISNDSNEEREYKEILEAAIADVFHFVEIKRTESWTVLYEGPHGTMQLIINERSTQWLLFAKPSSHLPARCVMREIFAKPIAKMTPDGTLLTGHWKISRPISTKSTISISAVKNKKNSRIKAYPARCGVVDPNLSHKEVWKTLKVEKLQGSGKLEHDVCGSYDLLPDCGTASGSLYKREAKGNIPDLFLFLDPHKCEDVKHDSFVFAFEHNRIAGFAPRIIIAELSAEWRPENVTSTPQPATNLFHREWKDAPGTRLEEVTESEVSCESKTPRLSVTVHDENDSHAYEHLMIATGPTSVLNFQNQDIQNWQVHNIEKDTRKLDEIAWAFKKISSQMGHEEWKKVEINGSIPSDLTGTLCEICHPERPAVVRSRNDEDEYELNRDAANYERLMKTRPPKWVLRTRARGVDEQEMQLSLSIQAMVHLAVQKLLPILKDKSFDVSWRLKANSFNVGRKSSEKFKLKDASQESLANDPTKFNGNLREEQRRSLTWMINQENHEVEPYSEMEVEEASLPALAWRAEVKITTQTTIRGGLCADEVGFGKTALFLALISSQLSSGWHDRIPVDPKGKKESINATLIIVPSNIVKQWSDEIEKFLGEEYQRNHVLVFHQRVGTAKTRKDASEIPSKLIVLVNVKMLDKCISFLGKYRWARLVIDEYHLLWKKESPMDSLLSLCAYSKWILSGTPGLQDFADVKTIATLLGAHLGIDDDGDVPSENDRLCRIRENYTKLERLEMFRPVCSEDWYRDRRMHAQEFLDRFARQNFVKDTVDNEPYFPTSTPSADERRVYSQLEDYLRSHGDTARVFGPNDKTSTGTEKCLNEIMSVVKGKGQDEKHALLLCSLSATYQISPYGVKICAERIKDLKGRFKQHWRSLGDDCDQLMKEFNAIDRDSEEQSLLFRLVSQALCDIDGLRGFGDPEIAPYVGILSSGLTSSIYAKTKGLKLAEIPMESDEGEESGGIESSEHPDFSDLPESEGNSDVEAEEEDAPRDDNEENREVEEDHPMEQQEDTIQDRLTHRVVTGLQDLAKTKQDLRFWVTALRIHPQRGHGTKDEKCSSCKQSFGNSIPTLIRSCGHLLCEQCQAYLPHRDGDEDKDKICAVKKCSGSASLPNQLHPADFDNAKVSKHSSKLQDLIRIINDTPPTDKILVFNQYPEMFEMIYNALEDAGITTLKPIKGKMDDVFEEFKKGATKRKKETLVPKVLLLLLGGEDMAGQNLQTANHVIFLSPRVAESDEQCDADMQQAIGRVRRPGQLKQVHVHHMIAKETEDVAVIEKWTGKLVVRRKDAILVSHKRKGDEWMGGPEKPPVRRKTG